MKMVLRGERFSKETFLTIVWSDDVKLIHFHF